MIRIVRVLGSLKMKNGSFLSSIGAFYVLCCCLISLSACTPNNFFGQQIGHVDYEFNGKYGYIDKSGQFKIPPRFDDAKSFSNGLAFVNDSGKLGYIDKSGRRCISCEKASVAGSFFDGLAILQTSHKSLVGYINKKGKVAIQPIFASFQDFHEGRAAVQLRNASEAYQIIDTTGNFIGKQRFAYCGDFHEGYAVVLLKPGQMTYIDRHGEFASAPNYENCLPFSDGIALVVKNGMWSAIGKDFIPRNEFLFDAALDDFRYLKKLVLANEKATSSDSSLTSVICRFSEELAAVRLGGLWGYMNKDGQLVISPQFNEANTFSEGLASVRVDDRYGFINKSGQVVISPQFKMASSFHDGLARIEVNGKVGFINKKGKFQIEPKFEIAGDFTEGLSLVGIGAWAEQHIEK